MGYVRQIAQRRTEAPHQTAWATSTIESGESEVKYVESFLNRRRHVRALRDIYARANNVGSPAMRDELLVIAQRDH